MSHPDDRSGQTVPTLKSIGIAGEAHAVGRIQCLEAEVKRLNGVISETVTRAELPSYSVELLAANYPTRTDASILSGPYTPTYIAAKRIEVAVAERDQLASMDDAAMDKMQAMIREQSERIVAVASYAELLRRAGDRLRIIAEDLAQGITPTDKWRKEVLAEWTRVATTPPEASRHETCTKPPESFSAAVPTTTPCNEQCEPNGCVDCPVAPESEKKPMQEAQERIQRDMATKGTARVQDVFTILGDPSKSVTLPASEAMNELARQVVSTPDTRTEAEIIRDGVSFVMGPGGDEGTRVRSEFQVGRYEPPNDAAVDAVIEAARATGMPLTALRWAIQRLSTKGEKS